MRGTRSVVVWCADWPVVALETTGVTSTDHPVAVVRAERIVASSSTARAEGVVMGLRRREAQRRCPALDLRERDLEREARAFEAVAAGLDAITPRVEILQPGSCRFPARGPSRYFGGDEEMALATLAAVRRIARDLPTGRLTVGVGVADGTFAAMLAARRATATSGSLVVPLGGAAAFLAPLSVQAFERPDLSGVLERLGLLRLGQFAALSPADVTARFGADGARAHRQARGLDDHAPELREPSPDLEVVAVLDPPLERVGQGAFVAKMMADDLHERLARHGLAAVSLLVAATSAEGHCVERRWRHDGALTSAGVAQRVRWQLDGWLTHSRATAGALARLSLCADEVIADVGRQQSLWGGNVATDAHAMVAVARVQAMLGSDEVRMAEWRGGRSPNEQYQLVPVDVVDRDAPPVPDERPWPGQLPDPPPALVWNRPRRCQVVDADGAPLGVDGRGVSTGVPARASIESGPWCDIEAWAGPWVVDERWWDAIAHRRRARYQVVLDDGTAHLVSLEASSWWLEATYD